MCPTRAPGPALNDLMGGRVDMLFDNLPGSLPSVQAGLIRPIAVTAAKRIPELPDVPAMAEILPGYEMTSWTIMIGPAGLRGDVIERANALTVKALADDVVKKRYGELGATVWPTSPDEAARLSRQGGEAAAADHEGGGDQAGVGSVTAPGRSLRGRSIFVVAYW